MLRAVKMSGYEYFYVSVMGLVQGIAEFLPISSSGHLVITGELLSTYLGTSVPEPSATTNIALHFGSLLSIAVVYRHDLWGMRRDFRTMALIAAATVPVGIVGLTFKHQIEGLFSSPLAAGICLLVTAGLLLISRRVHHVGEGEAKLKLSTAIVVGLFQAIAIMPGISRAGSTIAAGLMCGLPRQEAAKFSFLIAIPAIGGATLVKAAELMSGPPAVDSNWLPLLPGTLISFVTGVVCLRWLIRLVVADRLHLFAFYCIVVGTATVIWQLSLSDGLSSASQPLEIPDAESSVPVEVGERSMIVPA